MIKMSCKNCKQDTDAKLESGWMRTDMSLKSCTPMNMTGFEIDGKYFVAKAEVNQGYFVPKKILKYGIATIVFWVDGTKTIVKRAEGEPDDEYAAFTAALAKKIFGSTTEIIKVIKNKTEYRQDKKESAIHKERIENKE